MKHKLKYTVLLLPTIAAAMLLYNAATVAVLGFAGIGFRLRGVALWPAVIFHTIMSVWCVASLRRSSKTSYREDKHANFISLLTQMFHGLALFLEHKKISKAIRQT